MVGSERSDGAEIRVGCEEGHRTRILRMAKTRPTTVSEYIKAAPKESQKHLREIRAILKSAAPRATETIKWGSPVLEDRRILFSYSAFKSHLNFMPTGPAL